MLFHREGKVFPIFFMGSRFLFAVGFAHRLGGGTLWLHQQDHIPSFQHSVSATGIQHSRLMCRAKSFYGGETPQKSLPLQQPCFSLEELLVCFVWVFHHHHHPTHTHHPTSPKLPELRKSCRLFSHFTQDGKKNTSSKQTQIFPWISMLPSLLPPLSCSILLPHMPPSAHLSCTHLA